MFPVGKLRKIAKSQKKMPLLVTALLILVTHPSYQRRKPSVCLGLGSVKATAASYLFFSPPSFATFTLQYSSLPLLRNIELTADFKGKKDSKSAYETKFFLRKYLAYHIYKQIPIEEKIKKAQNTVFSGPKMLLFCLKSVP